MLGDDESDITITLTTSLEDNGFEVDSFNDPESVLSNFKSGIYDIALIDIKMPQYCLIDIKMPAVYCIWFNLPISGLLHQTENISTEMETPFVTISVEVVVMRQRPMIPIGISKCSMFCSHGSQYQH